MFFTCLAITALAGGAFVAFNGYVWAKAPSLGSQPECNSSTVYVMFGVSIPHGSCIPMDHPTDSLGDSSGLPHRPHVYGAMIWTVLLVQAKTS